MPFVFFFHFELLFSTTDLSKFTDARNQQELRSERVNYMKWPHKTELCRNQNEKTKSDRNSQQQNCSGLISFILKFLKCTLPSLNLARTIAPNRGLHENRNRMANIEDPDKTAHYEPSYQDLHCLHKNCLVCKTERLLFYGCPNSPAIMRQFQLHINLWLWWNKDEVSTTSRQSG